MNGKVVEGSIPQIMSQTFFVMVKPDGMGSVARIRQMILDHFLKNREEANLLGARTVMASREVVLQHYAKPDEWLIKYGRKILKAKNKFSDDYQVPDEQALTEGKKIPEAIADYMAGRPMWAMVLSSSALNTFELIREVLGDTQPSSAKEGTIRKAFSDDSFHAAWTEPSGARAIHNVCHASESAEEAFREVRIYFDEESAGVYFKDYLKEVARKENEDLIRLGRSAGKSSL